MCQSRCLFGTLGCCDDARKVCLGEQEKEKRMRSVTRLDCQQHIWHARLPAHFKMPRLTCVNVNKYLSVQEHKRYAQAHHHEGKISKKNPRLSPGKYLASTYMWESFILLIRNLKTERLVYFRKRFKMPPEPLLTSLYRLSSSCSVQGQLRLIYCYKVSVKVSHGK